MVKHSPKQPYPVISGVPRGVRGLEPQLVRHKWITDQQNKFKQNEKVSRVTRMGENVQAAGTPPWRPGPRWNACKTVTVVNAVATSPPKYHVALSLSGLADVYFGA